MLLTDVFDPVLTTLLRVCSAENAISKIVLLRCKSPGEMALAQNHWQRSLVFKHDGLTFSIQRPHGHILLIVKQTRIDIVRRAKCGKKRRQSEAPGIESFSRWVALKNKREMVRDSTELS